MLYSQEEYSVSLWNGLLSSVGELQRITLPLDWYTEHLVEGRKENHEELQ